MMELEIKLMSCKGLTSFNFFQKLSVYATVSIIPQHKTLKLTQSQKQEQKTPIDDQGGGNPEWNSTITFDLSPPIISSNLNNLAIIFQLRTPGQIFGDKEIGQVRVPLKDLVGVEVGRLVSYEVRGSDGKHNGVLDFSYKLINKQGLGNYRPHEKIEYPKIENLNLNPTPSNWIPLINPQQYWPPQPVLGCCGLPPPPPPLPPPVLGCCGEAPPRVPYAYQPPPYWGYDQQQVGGGGRCEYPHW